MQAWPVDYIVQYPEPARFVAAGSDEEMAPLEDPGVELIRSLVAALDQNIESGDRLQMALRAASLSM